MHSDHIQPKIVELSKIGSPQIGYLSFIEANKEIPFEVKRVFWTYYTPEEVVRGRHAHHQTEMILIAVSGVILVTVEGPDSQVVVFKLSKPNEGVYIPPLHWHTMQFSHNAVLLVLASTYYDESDYIRDYQDFIKLNKK